MNNQHSQKHVAFWAKLLDLVKSQVPYQTVEAFLREDFAELNEALVSMIEGDFYQFIQECESEEKIAWCIVLSDVIGILKNSSVKHQASSICLFESIGKMIDSLVNKDLYPRLWIINKINLGNSYDEKHNGDAVENSKKAISLYNQAIEFATQKQLVELRAGALGNVGVAYCNLKDESSIEHGIEALESALEYYEKSNPYYHAFFKKNLAWAYTLRQKGSLNENLVLALSLYNQCVEFFSKDSSFDTWFDIQKCIARVYRDLGEPDSAIKICKLVLGANEIIPHWNALRELGYLLGEISFNASRWEDAILGYGIAVESVEYSRRFHRLERGLKEPGLQISAISIEIYSKLIQACIFQKCYRKAVEYVERNKAKNWVELLYSNEMIDFEATTSNDLIAEYTHHLQVYLRELHLFNIFELVREHEVVSDKHNRPDITPSRERIDELSEQSNGALADFYFIESSFRFLSYEKILEIFSDDCSCAFLWYLGDNSIFTFLIQPTFESPVLISSPSSNREELRGYINTYIDEYTVSREQWKNNLSTHLKNFSRILQIEYVMTCISELCQKIVLVPYYYLHLIPFHALPVNQSNDCLIDLFGLGISYSPNFQFLCRQNATPYISNSHSFCAISNPTKDLPYSGMEVEVVRHMFSSSAILSEDSATFDSIKNMIQNKPDCIHFAGHAVGSLSGPAESALNFANGKIGPFSVSRFKLKGCKLVVLSACETGLVDVQFFQSSGGDEYLGLVGGFLAAGVSNIISSLWTVNDFSTAIFMIKFYENLLLNDDCLSSSVSALCITQRWLRQVTHVDLADFLDNYQYEINVFLDQLPSQRRVLMEMSLENIRKKTGKVFSQPYHWASFAASGL